ncbi:MAG: hypothetical protein ACYDAZ_00670 [Thermoplasmataceae archaeon]
MNRFDIEFWNGSLKTAILIEKEIKILIGLGDASLKEGLKVAALRIQEIKNQIEALNGNSVMKALRSIDAEL